jgi:hypothetical protein
MLRLGLIAGTTWGGIVLASAPAQATPILTLAAYVTNPATGAVVASETETIAFDSNMTFQLPAGFGAYTTGTGRNAVHHPGYASGTFSGSGASASQDIAVQAHLQAPTYNAANAPGDFFVAITELDIPGGGRGTFSFSDSGVFVVPGTVADYDADYSPLDRLFPNGAPVDRLLPYSHVSGGRSSFDDSLVIAPTAVLPALFSISTGFELIPASRGNPLADGELSVSMPEPASILPLGFGLSLTAGLAILRPKRRG